MIENESTEDERRENEPVKVGPVKDGLAETKRAGGLGRVITHLQVSTADLARPHRTAGVNGQGETGRFGRRN
ncbi:MAG TPA: hypothetical protein VM639_12850 [Dongiaceae bacterium]|nr:hypothetical protein [Dongiaceae bacterium]